MNVSSIQKSLDLQMMFDEALPLVLGNGDMPDGLYSTAKSFALALEIINPTIKAATIQNAIKPKPQKTPNPIFTKSIPAMPMGFSMWDGLQRLDGHLMDCASVQAHCVLSATCEPNTKFENYQSLTLALGPIYHQLHQKGYIVPSSIEKYIHEKDYIKAMFSKHVDPEWLALSPQEQLRRARDASNKKRSTEAHQKHEEIISRLADDILRFGEINTFEDLYMATETDLTFKGFMGAIRYSKATENNRKALEEFVKKRTNIRLQKELYPEH